MRPIDLPFVMARNLYFCSVNCVNYIDKYKINSQFLHSMHILNKTFVLNEQQNPSIQSVGVFIADIQDGVHFFVIVQRFAGLSLPFLFRNRKPIRVWFVY